ncbi:DUF6288 domain-containing protein [Haloferula sp.]|uniref:DUF6288 domain-containing protein n=1 Tax=Haloferula sp. TaxID=2497595 RepID=UPI003C743FCF
MPSRILSFSALAPLIITALTLAPCYAAGPQERMSMPDFTKGDSIPNKAKHDWTLGATGTRGWMFSDKLETTDARQIAITKVDKGSPSEGILEPGDVVLGVGGKPFSFDPRTEMGEALTKAESEAGGGKLSLIRWRDGKRENVVVNLPVLGSYSATAPYDCPKSKRILEQGCEALAKRLAEPGYKQNPITRSLNALALLASGDPSYLPPVKREAQWAADFSAESFQTWYYGYTIMLLAEYVMATGDDSVMPGLRRLALEASEGQSMVGSWGHRFAGPDDRLIGYGMMNAPGIPLTISLVMARAAGVKDPEISLAIERSARLLRFYIGKGAIPYGDHHPWIQTHEDNGKCGMAAVLFNLLGEREGAEFFSRMSLASHGSERDTGHTGNFFNLLWAMPGLAQSGPQASGAWMAEFGASYFDFARRWDGTFLHQGPPQTKNDSYPNWDSSGGYLLAYALPLRNLWLTGKRPSEAAQLDADEAQAVVNAGRGWSNKNRNGAYDQLSGEILFESLASWSPVVRERAAMAIARRKNPPVDALIELLDSPDVEARYGACQTLALVTPPVTAAIPVLRKNLKHEDLWLRVKAAEALASMGKAAMPALPEILEMLAKGPSEEDPRAMEQRYLCFAVFGKMLKGSVEGVDRDKLREAVAAGLQNQDGRARGSVGEIYKKLSYEEIEALLPAIYEAIVTPAPSGIMFASSVRLAGIELLAKHRIAEGMPLCIEVMDIDKWGKGGRIPRCLKALAKYGAAAKPMLPELHQLQKDLLAHREAKNLKSSIEQLQLLISDIESATDSVELRHLQNQ